MAEDELKEIRGKIDSIESILKEYLSFRAVFGGYEQIVSTYFRLANMLLTRGKITPSMLIGEKLDTISEGILEVLFTLERANITRITDELRKETGAASRTTVRKKLKELQSMGFVAYLGDAESSYEISGELVNRWMGMVGLNVKHEEGQTGNTR